MVHKLKKKTIVKNQTNKTGILFINLGSPDAPTTDAVHDYLKQFLSDPNVIKVPRLKWWAILNGIILPFRAPKSAKLYQKIWGPDGSPLITISNSFTNKLSDFLDERFQAKLAMRYGNPSIESKLLEFNEEGFKQIKVVPLFPQYSETTTGSIILEIKRILELYSLNSEISIVKSFNTASPYIQNIERQINEVWQKEKTSRILLSFHGIPKSYADDGDHYPQECLETFESIRAISNIPPDVFKISFQSRFGKEEWLKPYTDETLETLALEKKSVLVLCPGFTVDCLETIDEINREYRHLYESKQGPKMIYLPCLNNDPKWCESFAEYVITAPSQKI